MKSIMRCLCVGAVLLAVASAQRPTNGLMPNPGADLSGFNLDVIESNSANVAKQIRYLYDKEGHVTRRVTELLPTYMADTGHGAMCPGTDILGRGYNLFIDNLVHPVVDMGCGGEDDEPASSRCTLEFTQIGDVGMPPTAYIEDDAKYDATASSTMITSESQMMEQSAWSLGLSAGLGKVKGAFNLGSSSESHMADFKSEDVFLTTLDVSIFRIKPHIHNTITQCGTVSRASGSGDASSGDGSGGDGGDGRFRGSMVEEQQDTIPSVAGMASLSQAADSVFSSRAMQDAMGMGSMLQTDARATEEVCEQVLDKSLLSQEFVMQVMDLPIPKGDFDPNGEEAAPYKGFIHHYGTHFIRDVVLGGQVEMVTRRKKGTTSASKSAEIAASLSVSLMSGEDAGETVQEQTSKTTKGTTVVEDSTVTTTKRLKDMSTGVSAEAGASVTAGSSSSSEAVSSSDSTSLKFIGCNPAKANGPASIPTWVASCGAFPAPTSRKMAPITNVMVFGSAEDCADESGARCAMGGLSDAVVRRDTTQAVIDAMTRTAGKLVVAQLKLRAQRALSQKEFVAKDCQDTRALIEQVNALRRELNPLVSSTELEVVPNCDLEAEMSGLMGAQASPLMDDEEGGGEPFSMEDVNDMAVKDSLSPVCQFCVESLRNYYSEHSTNAGKATYDDALSCGSPVCAALRDVYGSGRPAGTLHPFESERVTRLHNIKTSPCRVDGKTMRVCPLSMSCKYARMCTASELPEKTRTAHVEPVLSPPRISGRSLSTPTELKDVTVKMYSTTDPGVKDRTCGTVGINQNTMTADDRNLIAGGTGHVTVTIIENPYYPEIVVEDPRGGEWWSIPRACKTPDGANDYPHLSLVTAERTKGMRMGAKRGDWLRLRVKATDSKIMCLGLRSGVSDKGAEISTLLKFAPSLVADDWEEKVSKSDRLQWSCPA